MWPQYQSLLNDYFMAESAINIVQNSICIKKKSSLPFTSEHFPSILCSHNIYKRQLYFRRKPNSNQLPLFTVSFPRASFLSLCKHLESNKRDLFSNTEFHSLALKDSKCLQATLVWGAAYNNQKILVFMRHRSFYFKNQAKEIKRKFFSTY